MSSRKILLINLSKGKLGEENSSFFGSMFITKIKQAGMARAALPEEKRIDFYLYVDEFHNLVTASFVNLFTEARKYGMSLTASHQYIGQLLPEVFATVLGNTATLIVFRVGGEDAVKLEPEMTPLFKTKDMINLGTQEFYIKETIDGETYDPFSAETLKVLPPTHPSYKERIREASRRKYSMQVDEVKRMLKEEEEAIIFRRETPAEAAGTAEVGAGERRGEENETPPEPLI